MGHECEADDDVRVTAHNRWLDLAAFGVIALAITLSWLPTLTSGDRVNPNEDFYLHASRHEAVRKSLVEYGSFPLRSHWFGGGFPTLGEPEDPALNPGVLLSVLFGTVMGLKLIGFLAALVGGLSTYPLGRYVLGYTRWGALFSALVVGTAFCIPAQMEGGNLPEVWAGYLPLCLLLIGLACRGRRAALFLLPLVFCTMLSSGKQSFFTAMFYLAVLCLLDALPTFRSLAPETSQRKLYPGALKVLALGLGVAFVVGMVRILPVLEFLGAKGGLTHMEIYFHRGLEGGYGIGRRELFWAMFGLHGRSGLVTIGWAPVLLLAVACCCYWKRALPWAVTLVLCYWLALVDDAPINLFGLLERLPVFSTMARPYKYFSFQVVLSIAVGAGQPFWLLRRLQHRWIEHVCAVVLIMGALVFLYPRAVWVQDRTYTGDTPSSGGIEREGFYQVQGLNLVRNRKEPARAITYLNTVRNIGTIDWHTSMPIAENAIPKYFVDAENAYTPNHLYRGEAFFVGDEGPSTNVGKATFRPNAIAVEVTVPKPGVLVINQNHHRAWSTNRGELFERDGMLAVRLRETGSYAIHLRYLPMSFPVGLAVSVLSIAGWAIACWKFGNRCAGRARDEMVR
jgi:hypothetical protein